MKKGRYWFSWLLFLVSICVTLAGAIILLKTRQLIGLYINYVGIIGLCISGLIMTITYVVPAFQCYVDCEKMLALANQRLNEKTRQVQQLIKLIDQHQPDNPHSEEAKLLLRVKDILARQVTE